jgi:SSS family transporter
MFLVRDAKDAAKPPSLATFHTITGAWALLPEAPTAGARSAMPWHDGLAWQRAGANGGTEFGTAEPKSGKLLLRWLDWIVIVVYLASMVGMGLYFYLREKRNSTSEFFVGGREIPFWAAGISLYAANTSSISFIAIPAKAFETNWQYLTNNLVAVTGLMFVGAVIVPLLRRLDLMSVFSYLETRFHPAIRMFASALCIVMQIGSRMSVILFLPALAIATITGIDVVWSVLLMGTFTIIYTAMGGMKAVIWTDVVQVIVKMGGAVFAIVFVAWHLSGGFGELASVALAENKTKLLDFSFDLTQATVWGFVFLVLFDVVLTFPKDQVLMQRTLSTKSDKEAGRSIWAFALIMIPGGFIFYSIGTALYVYYQTHPERLDPLLPIDATFPLFIAAELPIGVTGLIIAGIFAAAMATLSSIMNSVATLVSVDFYEKLAKNPTPKKSVLFAELATVATGLVGIGVALVLSRFDIRSLFDVSIELAGLLGGGFAGAYTLGMFTRRANSPGVAIGVVGSIVLTLIAWWMRLVHPYFYLAISIALCIVIGYAASLFFPAPTRSLDGLTIYSRKKG